jgi:hypothetical protein
MQQLEEDDDQLEIRMDPERPNQKGKGRKSKKPDPIKMSKEDEEKFDRDYYKMGGIQHIICSATMTIDNQGRITPRKRE